MATTDIELKLTLDSSNFRNTLNKEKIYARDAKVELNKNLLAKLELDVAGFQVKLDAARKTLRDAKKKGDLNATIKAQLDVNELQRGTTEAKRQLNNYVNTGNKDLSRLQVKFNQVTDEIKASRDEMIKLGKNTKGIDLIIKKMDQVTKDFKTGKISVTDYNKQLSNLKTQADNVGTSFGGLKNILLGVAGFGLLRTFKEWAGGSVLLASNLQQAEIAFTSMLGSAEQAQVLLQDLSNFAKKTPFEITGIRQTAKQLLAFGFGAEEIVPTLKALGDVASGLSVPIEQVAYAYGQVRTANQLYGTELRQFVNAGVPLLAELAKQFGVTESEAKKMVELGQVSFKDVEQAFKTMTEEGGQFNNLMAAQSTTIAGLWSNLRDTITLLAESLGTKLIPAITNALNFVLDFTAKYPQLTKVLAIGTTAILGLGGALALLAPVLFTASTAGALFSASLLPIIGTIGLVVGAVAVVGTAFNNLGGVLDKVQDKIENSTKAQKELNDELERMKKRQGELEKEMNNVSNAFDRGEISIDSYNKQLKLLQEEYKNNENKINDFQKAVDILNDKLKNYEQKIEEINQLALNDSEYQKIITRLFEIEVGAQRAKNELSGLLTQQATGAGSTILGGRDGAYELNLGATEETKSWLDFAQGMSKAVRTIKNNVEEVNNLPPVSTLGGGSGKSLEDIEKERQRELLRQQALFDIKTIKQSEKTEVEKAKEIIRINEKLSDDLKKIDSDEIEISSITAKKLIELEEEKQNEIIKLEEEKNKTLRKLAEDETYLQEESGKIFDDVISEKEKRVEDFEKKLLDLNKSIEDINEELKTLEEGRAETLGERNVKILEREKEIRQELNELERDGIDIKKASQIGLNTLQNLGTGTISGASVQDLLKAVELTNELNSLTNEKALIDANATQEELDNQKQLAELSPTARFLQEFETRKQILQQERALKQAEILDLEFQKTEELSILDKFRADKEELDLAYREKVASVEAGITDDLRAEVDRRKLILEDLRADVVETQTALDNLASEKADINRQVIQSQNNFGDVNISNDVDTDSFFNKLRP